MTAYTPLSERWCTGERQPPTARISDRAPWSFTRTPGAYTCSDKGKRTGVRETRTPATQKPTLTRGNAYRSPVHPYGADPQGVRTPVRLGSLVYAATPSSRMTHPRAGANQ